MPTAPTNPKDGDACMVAVVDDALQSRFRLVVWCAAGLGLLALAGLLGADAWWGKGATTALFMATAIGVPILGWRYAIPFAGRMLAPITFLAGVSLEGRDARDSGWLVAMQPVLWFVLGWLADICLSQPGRIRELTGRVVFSVVWIIMAWYRPSHGGLEAVALLLGAATVWMPRPRGAWEESLPASATVKRGLRKAGGWLTGRFAMGLLVALPSLIYLDLLDMPAKLKVEMERSGGGELLHWLRENRELKEEDCSTLLEVHGVVGLDPMAWKKAIRVLRNDPANPQGLEGLRALSQGRIPDLASVREVLDMKVATVFYVQPNAASGGRATAGLLWSTDKELQSSAELMRFKAGDLQRLTNRFNMAAVVMLATSGLMILVMSSPGGGSAVGWWLAIYLAGSNMVWARDSVQLVLEPARYVVWRDFGYSPAGGLLMGLELLVAGLMQLTRWSLHYHVAMAGLLVALCSPARPSRIIKSPMDEFWAQLPKVVALSVVIFLLMLLAMVADQSWDGVYLAWLIALTFLYVGGGFVTRKWTGRHVRLPALGVLAVVAFVMRRMAGVLWDIESYYFNVEGGWMGILGVVLAVAAVALVVLAMDRGEFLSPPHVEGQLWLVAVAALPMLAGLLEGPIDAMMSGSGVLFENSSRALLFVIAMFAIEPLTRHGHRFLERWSAKGISIIESAQEALLARPGGESLLACRDTVLKIGVKGSQIWRHLGEGACRQVVFDETGESSSSVPLIPARLAERMGDITGGLRLEEMRTEWRWAAFAPELENLFAERGDLLIIPANHSGTLIGLMLAPDLPENRFLLRPVVCEAVGELLATALLQTWPAGGTSQPALAVS